LTVKEIEIISFFSNGFPKIVDLAERENHSHIQLRKYFSRIYSKLGIDDIQQLVRILTICELFNKQP
jgi:hypothetical protein